MPIAQIDTGKDDTEQLSFARRSLLRFYDCFFVILARYFCGLTVVAPMPAAPENNSRTLSPRETSQRRASALHPPSRALALSPGPPPRLLTLSRAMATPLCKPDTYAVVPGLELRPWAILQDAVLRQPSPLPTTLVLRAGVTRVPPHAPKPTP